MRFSSIIRLSLLWGLVTCLWHTPTVVLAADTTTASSIPQNPTNVSAKLTASTTIALAWTPVGSADYFWIYRSTSGNPSYTDVFDIISGSRTSYTNTNLQSGTTYSYRVRAVKGWSEASLSDAPVVSRTTEGSTSGSNDSGSIPSATVFQVVKTSTSTITLAWPLISGVDQIRLYRSTQSASTFFIPLTNLSSSALSYVDAGLTPSTTYYYRLTTVKNGVETPLNLAPVVNASTPAYIYTAPTTVTSLIATAQAGSSIMLTWSYDGPAVDNFHIFRNSYGSYGTFDSVTLVPGTARTYIDSNLSPGATYYYRLTTIGKGIESSLSSSPQAVATAVIDPTTPNVATWWYYYPNYTYSTYPTTYYSGSSYTTTYPSYVSNLSGTAVNSSQARLTWTSSGPADGFVIYQSPDNFIYSPVATVQGSVTSYTSNYLLPGSSYWFKVASTRGGTESSAGSAVRITTPNTSGSSANTTNSTATNNSTITSERLLIPSRTISPIRFIFGSSSGIVSAQSPLIVRHQFKNTGTGVTSFIFKTEIITQYGSVLDTILSTEKIKSKATLTTPVRYTTNDIPTGLYTFKVSVYQKIGTTQKYLGENDFRFRVQ